MVQKYPTRSLIPVFALLAVLVAGCSSSPTAPSPPVAQPPPSEPTPPAQPPPPALSISCPSSITVNATSSAGATISFAVPATTGGVAPVNVSCTRPSGSVFEPGATTVQCTAVDAASQSVACTFSVTVVPIVPQLARTKFLAYGDSVTAGEITLPSSGPQKFGAQQFNPIVVPGASYPSQLVGLLRGRYTMQAAAVDVVTAAVPGEATEDGAARLPNTLRNVQPQVLLLMHGHNDLAFGSSGVSTAWRWIDVMAKEGRNRGARVFLATLAPPRTGGPKATPVSLVVSLNNLIRTTAAGEGAVLVDVYAALSIDVPRYIGVDGLHPTEAGYRKIAETFFDAIRADLEIR